MCKIINGFKNRPHAYVKWHHSDGSNDEISPGNEDVSPSEIGENEGYLTIKAVDNFIGGGIKSSLTLHPFSFNGHKVKLSYDKDNYEWKVMAEEIKDGDFKEKVISALIGLIKRIFQFKQVNVNVEIGP
jgi:uncharacterized protein YabN with tetrapyrrole methylase and pyrophosphatase domain